MTVERKDDGAQETLDRLFTEIDKLGISDADAARRMGKTPGFVSDLRRKKPDIRLSGLLAIMQTLDIDPKSVFSTGDGVNGKYVETPRIDDLLSEWRRCERKLESFDANLLDYCLVYGAADSDNPLELMAVGIKSLASKILGYPDVKEISRIVANTPEESKENLLRSNTNITPSDFSFSMQRSELKFAGGEVKVVEYDRLALPVKNGVSGEAVIVYSQEVSEMTYKE